MYCQLLIVSCSLLIYIEIDVKKNNLGLIFGPSGQVVTNDNCQTGAQIP